MDLKKEYKKLEKQSDSCNNWQCYYCKYFKHFDANSPWGIAHCNLFHEDLDKDYGFECKKYKKMNILKQIIVDVFAWMSDNDI